MVTVSKGRAWLLNGMEVIEETRDSEVLLRQKLGRSVYLPQRGDREYDCIWNIKKS